MVLKFLKWIKAPATVICLPKYLFLSIFVLAKTQLNFFHPYERFHTIFSYPHRCVLLFIKSTFLMQFRLSSTLKNVIKLERKHQCVMFFTRKFAKPSLTSAHCKRSVLKTMRFQKTFESVSVSPLSSACCVVFRTDICTVSAEAFNHAFYFRKRNDIDGRH